MSAIMSLKYLFYDFRNIVHTYGIWDQIRVDHGREWYLMLFINESIAHLRGNTSKQPHMQTSSTKVCLHGS